MTELLETLPEPEHLFIDIPVGLPEEGNGVRECDREARRRLTRKRGSSVFPVPTRQAVHATSWEEALERNRAAVGKGISKQAWYICPRIREVDDLLAARPELLGRVREAHPEVCFHALSGRPMENGKKTREGAEERLAVLDAVRPGLAGAARTAVEELRGPGVERDDVIDAAVLALTALHGDAVGTLPEDPPRDPRGIPMEMVCWIP